jgi:hypothetical protein
MPQAQPLPRKYLSVLENAQQELRCMASRARAALEELIQQGNPPRFTEIILRELEISAYRTALDLADLEVAGGCDSCPAAPPMTQAQATLLVMASELERQAEIARMHAHAVGQEDGLLFTTQPALFSGPFALGE